MLEVFDAPLLADNALIDVELVELCRHLRARDLDLELDVVVLVQIALFVIGVYRSLMVASESEVFDLKQSSLFATAAWITASSKLRRAASAFLSVMSRG